MLLSFCSLPLAFKIRIGFDHIIFSNPFLSVSWRLKLVVISESEVVILSPLPICKCVTNYIESLEYL